MTEVIAQAHGLYIKMISVEATIKKGGVTEKIKQSLKKLDKSWLAFGHWSSQGFHNSGLSYPELLEMWATGSVDAFYGEVQDPLAQFGFTIQNNGLDGYEMKPAYDFAENMVEPNSVEKFLTNMAARLRNSYSDIFGVVDSPFMPASANWDNETPMSETGELGENVGFKTSFNDTVKVF